MKKNVGGTERTARLVIGTVFVLVGAAGYAGLVPLASLLPQFLTSILVVLVGAILLVTGAIRWCPISAAIGRTSYRTEASETPEPQVEGQSEGQKSA